MPVSHPAPYRYPLTPPPSLPPIQPKNIQNTTVDISLLLQAKDEEAKRSVAVAAPVTAPASTTSSSPVSATSPVSISLSTSSNASSSAASSSRYTARSSSRQSVPAKRSAPPTDLAGQHPAKKQSKWSPEEDARIIQLRGDGMKWEDISKHLPGRSAISCRLHYQNYLERRSEWDEDRKNKLARLYERFKAEMWSRIAEEMTIPWRAAEAMHWQLGESEMARRAGVSLFTLVNNTSTSTTSTTTSNQNGSTGSGSSGRTQQRPSSSYWDSVPTPDTRRHASTAPAVSSHSRGSTPRPAEPSPAPTLPTLPSLAELTAGLPAFTPSRATTPAASTPTYQSGSLTATPFHEMPARRSLPPPACLSRKNSDEANGQASYFYDRRHYA